MIMSLWKFEMLSSQTLHGETPCVKQESVTPQLKSLVVFPTKNTEAMSAGLMASRS